MFPDSLLVLNVGYSTLETKTVIGYDTVNMVACK